MLRPFRVCCIPASLAMLTIALAPAIAQTTTSEFLYTASASVESGGRMLPAAYTGKVLAFDAKEAKEKAEKEVRTKVTEEYPGWKLVPMSLRLEVRSAPANATTAGATSVRLTVRSLKAFLKEGRPTLTILVPILYEDDEIID